jgi:hypothetical protein
MVPHDAAHEFLDRWFRPTDPILRDWELYLREHGREVERGGRNGLVMLYAHNAEGFCCEALAPPEAKARNKYRRQPDGSIEEVK